MTTQTIIHRKNKTQKYWTPEEVEYLRLHYLNTPNKILAEKLGRTFGSIQVRASALGFTGKRNYYRVEQFRMLSNNPFLRLSDAQRGYIAGLLDGEGSIVATKRTKRIDGTTYKNTEYFIQIANTDSGVMDWLKSILPEGRIYTIKQRGFGWKPLSRWVLFAKIPCQCLLSVLLPHLIIKKDSAQQLLNIPL